MLKIHFSLKSLKKYSLLKNKNFCRKNRDFFICKYFFLASKIIKLKGNFMNEKNSLIENVANKFDKENKVAETKFFVFGENFSLFYL